VEDLRIIGEPGHWREGADTNHFFGRCDECDLHIISRMTMGEVEGWYHVGKIGQDMYEAFMYVWATTAVRSDRYDAWKVPPLMPRVMHMVVALEIILQRHNPS
jgi:hypothetical protein